MRKETRTAVFDGTLGVEACRFEGIVQPFPNHFHEHYVIGFVESGQRILSCKNQDYPIGRGSIVLFHPGDNHGCVQSDGGTFDYRSFNISQEVMLDLAAEATGRRALPCFSENVIRDEEITCCLRPLHETVMHGGTGFGKEDALLLLISALMQKYGQPFACPISACPQEIERACGFMRQHFSQRIDLDRICRYAGLSKSTLLRAFTKAKGITPYRYLETVRINEAKKLLEQGALPIDAAMQTGFSDQSHFTNFFRRYIGLAPGVYREIFWGQRDGFLHKNEKE